MGGPQVYAEKPKKKIDTISTVTYKVGNKTYIAKFAKPPKAKDVIKKIPSGETKKEVNEQFAELAEKYGVTIYVKGGKKPLKKPPKAAVVQAGKALFGQAKRKTIDIKKLVPKL